jgi:hypothetical protein
VGEEGVEVVEEMTVAMMNRSVLSLLISPAHGWTECKAAYR